MGYLKGKSSLMILDRRDNLLNIDVAIENSGAMLFRRYSRKK